MHKVFPREVSNTAITFLRAKKASAEWCIKHKFTQLLYPTFLKTPATNCKKTQWLVWRKPQWGFIKINFGRSKTSQGAVRRFTICNREGRFIQVVTFNLAAASGLVAEAITTRSGIKATIHAWFTNVYTERDNKIFIQAIQGNNLPPWKIQVLIKDIITYLCSCNNVIINHIYHQQGNSVADWVGKYELSTHSTIMRDNVLNRHFHCIFQNNNLVKTLRKGTF